LAENSSGGLVLKNFVVRRALRIFPIYYLTLLIFYLFRHYETYTIEENLVYYLTYTSNILFFNMGFDGYLAPLWSLAVEEQFYLVWPILMLFVPNRYIPVIIITSILTGLVFPFFFENEMARILTPACLTALGSGALLAWLSIHRMDVLGKYRQLVASVALTALFLFVGISFGTNIVIGPMLTRLIFSLVAIMWIMYCMGIYSPRAVIDRVMNNSILLFIGQISYGIYLYNYVVTVIWRNLIAQHTSVISDKVPGFVFNAAVLAFEFAMLISLAWLSNRFIERPFLNMKKYFVLEKRTESAS
jgi:peptidoglycan/LPS O-acetylase OafA/YrhL